MALPSDFYTDFPPVSKADWLARIAKDLKGRPIDELYWQLSADITTDPFGHADDFPTPPAPLSEAPADWEIVETVNEPAAAAANAQALEALEFGAEGLRFHLSEPATLADLQQRLDGIYLDFIGLHFEGPGVAQNPGAVLGALDTLSKERGLATDALAGSLAYDPATATLPDWRYLADLMEHTHDHFPKFRVIGVDGAAEWKVPAGAADELAALLRRGNLYLQKLSERGVPVAKIAAQMQFSVAVGPSYFVEIAKLRAFKLLWMNVLQAWSASPVYPVLDVRFAPEAYTADHNSNLIRATTMAMSAVLGGADRLSVRPFDGGPGEPTAHPAAFGRRMARNVQHLLKMESFFAEIPDPAAGSYYVEKLTAQLAEAAWAKFQAQLRKAV